MGLEGCRGGVAGGGGRVVESVERFGRFGARLVRDWEEERRIHTVIWGTRYVGTDNSPITERVTTRGAGSLSRG